jgi:hypothetical protein
MGFAPGPEQREADRRWRSFLRGVDDGLTAPAFAQEPTGDEPYLRGYRAGLRRRRPPGLADSVTQPASGSDG